MSSFIAHSLKRAKSAKAGTDIVALEIRCIFGMYLEKDCEFAVELPATLPLFRVHEIIQEAVRFDDDHSFEFYAGRTWRNRTILFVSDEEEDYRGSWGGERETWRDDLSLKELFPLPKGCKLFYLFDFGDHWTFEIRKSRKKIAPVAGRAYPYLSDFNGEVPEQYPCLDEEMTVRFVADSNSLNQK